MSVPTRQIFFSSAFFLPVLVVLAAIVWRRAKTRARTRMPFESLRRRPAGESLRTKVESLNETLNETEILFLLIPWSAGFFVSLRPLGTTVNLILLIFSFIWAAVWGWRIFSLIKKRQNYLLGFDGERYVAEELNRLIGEGFEVFHDVQFKGFNVDHVLVGKRGVFAVETKARRKPINEAGNKKWSVEFDGSVLRWPMGADAYGIEQARNNAIAVSDWLSKAVGERVTVSAILTLPGWWVERKAPCRGVDILNPKEIAKRCGSAKKVLDDNLVGRVVYQLEQRCAMEVS